MLNVIVPRTKEKMSDRRVLQTWMQQAVMAGRPLRHVSLEASNLSSALEQHKDWAWKCDGWSERDRRSSGRAAKRLNVEFDHGIYTA